MENKLVEINGVKGYKSPCPAWLKLLYRKRVNFFCKDCKRQESVCGTLEPHRHTRGCQGGLYTIVPINHPDNNVDSLCKGCHRHYHQNEYKNCKSK